MLVWRQHIARNDKFHSPIIENPGPQSQMFKQLYTMMKTDCELEEVLGNYNDAEISPKAASEKAQTTMSENRYICQRIDFFKWPF